MKTKSLALIVSFLAIVLSSCENKGTIKESSSVVTTIVNVEPIVISDVNKDFANPANILGSNFGNFFVSMIRTQNYDMALKFTSKASIEKFGIDKIKEKYKGFNFNYKLFQKSESREGELVTIVYSTKEQATNKFKKITISIENDTCKVVLPEKLDEFLK